MFSPCCFSQISAPLVVSRPNCWLNYSVLWLVLRHAVSEPSTLKLSLSLWHRPVTHDISIFLMALFQDQCGVFQAATPFKVKPATRCHRLRVFVLFWTTPAFLLIPSALTGRFSWVDSSVPAQAIELNSLRLRCRERLTARVKGYEIKSESEGSENERNAAKKKFSIKVLMYN